MTRIRSGYYTKVKIRRCTVAENTAAYAAAAVVVVVVVVADTDGTVENAVDCNVAFTAKYTAVSNCCC